MVGFLVPVQQVHPRQYTKAVHPSGTHLLLLELLHHVLQQGIVKVLAAQEGVAVGGLDLRGGEKGGRRQGRDI